ncbi:MAG: response regulator [Crocinitomicaceae bacterium]|nr:response regulator [Crocinitomicaceae bacterium]
MSTGKVNIFLVDDNDIDLSVNSKLLGLTDFVGEITTFTSARKFLEELERIEGLAKQPNVLLLDIMMPGMDGFACLDAYSQLPDSIRHHIMVFMLSSSIDRNDIRRAENSPHVIRVLEKPLDVYLLKRLIENNLMDQRQV